MERKQYMHTNELSLKRETESCGAVPSDRDLAMDILAQMNGMLRNRPFLEVYAESRFASLNERLQALGWLGLIGKLTAKDGKHYAQLKLVDPDSEEARMLV